MGVDERGIVGLDALADVLGARNGDVAVVSVIAVNNETGSITPLPEVARVVRDLAPGALLHTDAVQAVNWIDVAAETAGYDLVSVTGHKVGSPVGTGVLVVRDGVELDPLIVGGGQERGRRAGTPDVAGAVSFAAALVETTEQRDASVERLRVLRDALIDGLTDRLGDRVLVSAARTNGDRGHIAAGIANVCIAGVQSEALLFLMDAAGVRASAASSCSSGAQDPSHVLAAMGVPREVALGSLRLSLGHTSVATDVERAVEVIAASVERLDRFEGG
ncbi:MAG: aminotransferase class V-fold PLP-dependent enzyme [Acidimicrobiaceae bacterium]|nr:aminotransferase class V-fold PLP-dependent enzyme [Acidimicrobiaceae bacterium]